MKRTLHFQMVTAAGAGTYAATLIRDNGKVRNSDAYTSDKLQAITRVQIMGANGMHTVLARSSHPGDDLDLIQIADTLADQDKVIDLIDILDGKGVELKASEALSLTVEVSGNATINIFIELDDSVPRVNAYAVRVAGTDAAVASTGVETGGNVPGAMNPIKTYRMRAIYATSTSIVSMDIGVNGNGLIHTPGQNAIVTGQKFQKLTKDQATLMIGTGSEYVNTFEAWITATAADAAAVQFLNPIFECN